MMGLGGDEWDNYAIQTLDSTKPNYNPAVAIVLQKNNIGTTLSEAPITNGGRWYLTKDEAATITILSNVYSGLIRRSWFFNIIDIVDQNGIVSSDNTLTYSLSSFNEFQYFTNYQFEQYNGGVGNAFMENCTKLEEITLPSQITSIKYRSFNGCSSLRNVSNINIQLVINRESFKNCGNLEIDDITNVVGIDGGAFLNCKKVAFTTINANVSSIREGSNYLGTFKNTISIPYIHFLSETAITGLMGFARTHVYNAFYGTTYKIYVGDGSSAAHDDAVLAAYLQVSPWSLMSADMDTWYNYLQSH
jgi:hypothetical protein